MCVCHTLWEADLISWFWSCQGRSHAPYWWKTFAAHAALSLVESSMMGVEPRGSVSPSLGGPKGGASEELTAGSQVSVQLPLVDEQQGELLSPMFCMHYLSHSRCHGESSHGSVLSHSL